MRSSILSFITLLASGALAAPAPLSHSIHEKRPLTDAWLKGDRVNEHVKLPVRIGLIQSNLDQGHDMLMDM